MTGKAFTDLDIANFADEIVKIISIAFLIKYDS